MRRLLLCGVLLASICFAQTEKPRKIVWRVLKSPDGIGIALTPPELLYGEVAQGRNAGDFLLLRNLTGQTLIVDPSDKAVCEQPPGILIGIMSGTRDLYYLSDEGLMRRKFASKVDTKIVPPGPGEWDYVEMENSIYAWSKKSWHKLQGASWVLTSRPSYEEKPAPKGTLYIVQAPTNDSQVYRSNDLGEPIQLSFQADTPGDLIANGVTASYLTEKQDRLVFQSQGHWFVCELRELSAADLKELADAEARIRAISNSKQSALAFLMFANDNADQLPESFNKADLEKYLKSSDALQDFVYTYTGPRDLNKIEEPAKTEVGYIPGPGGRAVAYADGHVKWIPDKKP